MNKTELIAEIAAKAGLSKKDAEKALAAVVDSVKEAVAKGDKVQLVGFGSFELKCRDARTGPQPQDQGSDPDPRFQGSRLQGRQGFQGRCRKIRFAEKRGCPSAAPFSVWRNYAPG